MCLGLRLKSVWCPMVDYVFVIIEERRHGIQLLGDARRSRRREWQFVVFTNSVRYERETTVRERGREGRKEIRNFRVLHRSHNAMLRNFKSWARLQGNRTEALRPSRFSVFFCSFSFSPASSSLRYFPNLSLHFCHFFLKLSLLIVAFHPTGGQLGNADQNHYRLQLRTNALA